MINPFKAVSLSDHESLKQDLATAESDLADKKREVSSLRGELEREMKNAERLSGLLARAVRSTEILEQALIERQVGASKDPSLVLVVNSLPGTEKKRHGFIPLQKRRRMAARRRDREETRRNALPTLTAQLPDIPLTKEDRAVVNAALNGSIEENA